MAFTCFNGWSGSFRSHSSQLLLISYANFARLTFPERRTNKVSSRFAMLRPIEDNNFYPNLGNPKNQTFMARLWPICSAIILHIVIL